MAKLQNPILLLTALLVLGSCASPTRQTQKAIYFTAISDSLLRNAMAAEYEPVFQKGDILSINVLTPNEASAKLFNQQVFSGDQQQSDLPNASTHGYLVNESGNISFPVLGDIKAAGVTRSALSSELKRQLTKYIDSSIVSIRLLNYRITVLGEVNKPGTYSIPSERVSILDALGLAGDLTVYGRRNNIRIIRTSEASRQTATLDLNKGDIFDSPFFYLRQNDVVYVEMNERKIPNSDQASLRNVSIALGIISALGVVISTINVFK